MDGRPYAGRFAPTPSGPLHVGSLIAAVASRCDALASGGRWMLRIDDIDPPRERAGAADAIPRSLARYGFAWDGPVRVQSARLDRYGDALSALARRGLLYRCGCTRRELRGDAPGRSGQPGRHGRHDCRERTVAAADVPPPRSLPDASPGDALRLRLERPPRADDLVQGPFAIAPEAGGEHDVVLRRRDALVAYPLACAVDDADVARVVRGADLLAASAAQLAVLAALELPRPEWAHVPLAVDARGRKLGKRGEALAIDALVPLPTLLGVWRFLGQAPITADSVEAFWREAPGRWSLGAVPRVRERPAPEGTA